MESNLLGYQEASQRWQIDRLLTETSQIKKDLKPQSKGLTDKEKEYICLLVLGCSPDEIFQRITATGKKISKGTITQCISDDIYPYLNSLLEQKSQKRKIKEWRDVYICLDQAGYRLQTESQRQQVLSQEELATYTPTGWIWIGAIKGTSQVPPVGARLSPLGLQNPVTIIPMEVPPIGAIVDISQYVNPRADRPQLSSEYRLTEQIGAPLIPGTRVIIFQIDSYFELSINFTKVWAKFTVFHD